VRATEPGGTVGGHGTDARPHVPTARPRTQHHVGSPPEATAAVEELLRSLSVVAAGLRNGTVDRHAAFRLVPPAGGITLLVVRRGELKLLHDANRPRTLVPGDAVLVSGGRPFALEAEEPTAEVAVATYAPTGGGSTVARLPEVLVRPAACGPGNGAEVLDVGARQDGRADIVVARMLDWLLPCHLASWLEDDPGAVDRLHVTDDVVGPVLRTLDESPQKPWSVADLAASVGVSRSTLTRRFRDRVGESPMRYLAGRRLALAAEHLRDSDAQLDTIARRTGYSDGFALSRAFSRAFGVSPSTYRRGHRPGATPGPSAPT
jgi:AraC-like DNA-binding protein